MKNAYVDGLQFALPTRDYFVAARRAGLDVIHVTVAFWENMNDTMRLLGEWFRRLDESSDLIYPASDLRGLRFEPADESDDNNNDGRVGILFGFQNCSPIENNIDTIEMYRRLNVGVMQLSYNNQSPLCGGCYESEDIGLSRFGRAAIAEMNRVGMVIDMSHSSARATAEAIAQSRRPIAITHAQSLTFRQSVRNKSDDLLRALAQSGGMLGLSFYPFHLKNTSQCTMSDLCDEVKRLIDVMGAAHIAIGSDLCQDRPVADLDYMRNGYWTKVKDFGESESRKSDWPAPPAWFKSVGDFARLEQAMIDGGVGAEETRMILGDNWLRFLRDALAPQ